MRAHAHPTPLCLCRSTGAKRGFPGLPFLFAAATNAGAQAVFSTLSDEELGIADEEIKP